MRITATIIITIAFAALNASVAAPKKEQSLDQEIPAYDFGIQALADHLPELAVKRFEEAYKVRKLSDQQNREILYRLTEAQVRANQPEKALITLRSKFFEKHPEKNFWMAHALAAQGQYRQAIKHFEMLGDDSKYRDEATLSLANLQTAVGRSQDAINNFQKAAKSSNAATRLKANTALIELYIEEGKLKRAKKNLASLPSDHPATTQIKALLDAQISLQSEQFTEAIAQFSTYLNADQPINSRFYGIALIGLADARHAAGQVQEAKIGLINFIKKHQNADINSLAFERLSAWSDTGANEDDRFFKQLQTWAGRDPKTVIGFPLAVISHSTINPFSPPAALSTISPDLQALAQYYYAKHCADAGTADGYSKAQFEFTAFRLLAPQHSLFMPSVFESARLQLLADNKDDARITLAILTKMAQAQPSPANREILTRAGFIAGLLNVESENYEDAMQAFDLATQAPQQTIADAAQFNLALAALRNADLAAFDAKQNEISDRELAIQLEVERALYLAHQEHPEARSALNTFLIHHPQHPQSVNARIALASISISQPPIDPIISKALLDSVDRSALNELQYTDYTRAAYLLHTQQQDWDAAIEALDNFLILFPESPHADEFTMQQGLTLYRNGEHNKARQLLTKLADDNPDSPLAPFCIYYAAMAARFEGTPQSLNESVDLFQNVIESKSALSTEARIQQARILLDTNRTEEAKSSLQKAYNPKSEVPQQREIGLLLATAHYTEGSESSAAYDKALAIYTQLLKQKDLPQAWSNQIHYMKGQTLENMDRDQDALDAYYQVINEEATHQQGQSQEWKWFYRCGFKALALLEKQQNFRAAVSVAKKVANAGGPESQNYAKRARDLEMKYMIWED
ncbi:tetratricopeptide repeat protein [Rubritalea marina]|uniref:tetratricopeptide repeat protein n=1 Tax=Rubritalea marina TaxID=361055 RepID=UPI000382BFBF|nr:tetratricopeptide repeat protein [Rubritalea marina]